MTKQILDGLCSALGSGRVGQGEGMSASFLGLWTASNLDGLLLTRMSDCLRLPVSGCG